LVKQDRSADGADPTEILVITENQDIAELLPCALAFVPDTHVTITAGMAQAQNFLNKQRPDLIVLDLDWLHVFDPAVTLSRAQATLDRLRASPNTREVPLVGLPAALNDVQLKSLNLTVGIRKPFGIFDFVDIVQRTLEK
jgi:CheY-like chemotaxis protein